MGRAGRKSDILSELREEGLPRDWQEFWQGQRSEIIDTVYSWRWQEKEKRMQGALLLRAVPGPEGTSLCALGEEDALFVEEDVRVPLSPSSPLSPDDMMYEDGRNFVALRNSPQGYYSMLFSLPRSHWSMSASERFHGTELVNGTPLLLLPGTEDSNSFLYYQGEEGLLYREFEDYFLSDSGEYILAEGSDWQHLATLPTLGRASALFYSPSGERVLCSDPDHEVREMNCPFQPKLSAMAGDPKHPLVAVASDRQVCILPHGDIYSRGGDVRDLSLSQEGDRYLMIWIEEDENGLHLCKPHEQNIPLPAGTDMCHALPGGGALLGGSSGVYFLSYKEENPQIRQISAEGVDEMVVSVRDESEAEVLLRSGDSAWMFSGEILREN